MTVDVKTVTAMDSKMKQNFSGTLIIDLSFEKNVHIITFCINIGGKIKNWINGTVESRSRLEGGKEVIHGVSPLSVANIFEQRELPNLCCLPYGL